MNCNLYFNQSTENKLNKVLTDKGTRTILFINSVDFIQPIITVKTLPVGVNYCYLERLERYYFIESVKNLKNELFELSLKCDVLMTYKNDIEKSKAIIIESTNEINPNNTDYIAEKNINVNEIVLENPFTENSDVLITIVGN